MDKTNTSYKTIIPSLEEMSSLVGKELGLSDWITIDQQSITDFGVLTKDEQWIHTDTERAAVESPYKQTIAHGFLILSYCSHFAAQCYKIEGVKMGINYGFDKVRFTNSTPAGARIRGRLSLLDYQVKENSSKNKFGLQIEIEGQTKPACIVEWITMSFV